MVDGNKVASWPQVGCEEKGERGGDGGRRKRKEKKEGGEEGEEERLRVVPHSHFSLLL